MDCDATAAWTVGPTARAYRFPLVSVTAVTVAVLLFQPTTYPSGEPPLGDEGETA
jgi:hypothetical protein